MRWYYSPKETPQAVRVWDQWGSVIFTQDTDACVFTSALFLGHQCSVVGKNLDIVAVSSFDLRTSLVKFYCSYHVGGLIRGRSSLMTTIFSWQNTLSLQGVPFAGFDRDSGRFPCIASVFVLGAHCSSHAGEDCCSV